MRHKDKRKQLAGLALGMCLAFSQIAYAEITIVPMPGQAGVGQTSIQSGGQIVGQASTQWGGQTVGQASTQSGGQASEQSGQSEPTVAAEGAVLMDSATGKVLYGKNQDTQFYPASITKVMTALVVLERCNLKDVVTFSETATTNLESGAVSLSITAGDQLTVEQALYGLMLKSANEIGNGLAEHVAGSVSAFADLMNKKAASLGCKNTHFANPHGLNDSTHKTTPYDMALILRAAFQNDTFRKIDSTLTYEFPATKKAGARTITMGHKMMYPSDSRYYEGIIGGKTGYTSLAGNTLVTGAERNGVRLIVVVMKSKGTQYTDTKALLDYGFANYAALTGQAVSSGAEGSVTVAPSPVTGTASSLTGPSSTPGTSTSPETPASPGTSTSPDAPSIPETASSVQPQPEAGDASGWKQDNDRWYYVKPDGKRAASEWIILSGLDYWFDSDGYMATGWRKFTNGAWYYFKPSSGYSVKSQWVKDGGCWYYLGADGVLLTNTTTPDGYRVNENGIWIQE